MHDYDLQRLNTRSFEQLVQALSLAEVGSNANVFGDGADGGREVTFRLAAGYPKGQPAWQGSGMMQAKFKQVLDSSPKKNADWAIEQLKGEFAKMKARSPRRPSSNPEDRICPDYYIFATNVSLSATARTGGKDRLMAVLEGYKKSHKLKGYAIWDGDQIRRLLDQHDGIRTSYAAYVLSGDVLSEVIRHFQLHKTDFGKTIQRYLITELLDDQYALLNQGGYKEAGAIPLSQVFVDLPVKQSSNEFDSLHGRTMRRVGKTSVLAQTQPSDLREAEKTRVGFLRMFIEQSSQKLAPCDKLEMMLDLLRGHARGRLVAVGGPGQGKTTLGQFACQLHRAALLKSTGQNYAGEVADALRHLDEQTRHLPQVATLRYPLRIDLKKLAEALAGKGDHPASSLLDYLVKHIGKKTDVTLTATEFRQWLAAYPWLLVLDGLDEVPASSNRTAVMDAVRNFIDVEAAQAEADLLVLATTRPQGYSDEFNPHHYQHFTLLPLLPEEALAYGRKLAEARHPQSVTRIEELTATLQRATQNPATMRLMESPLQVTIMLSLIEGGGEPPEHRWKLFSRYYSVIFDREKERRTEFSALLSQFESDIHWIHHRAGWILQQRNAMPGRTAERLSHTEFESLVEEQLVRQEHNDPKKRASLVKQIREAAMNRLVLLVGNTENEIGFEIRSLQEFMAAEHCFDGGENCIHESLHLIAPFGYWQNVVLFIVGRIYFERPSLSDTPIALCTLLNDPRTDALHASVLTGSRLALAILEDGAARHQPKHTRQLARCAARLFEDGDADLAPKFLGQFRGEAAEVWKEELSKRVKTSGGVFPHLAWRVCMQRLGSECEWAREMVQGHFPWGSEAISDFFARTMNQLELMPHGALSLLAERAPEISPRLWAQLRPNDLNLAAEFPTLCQCLDGFDDMLRWKACTIVTEPDSKKRFELTYFNSESLSVVTKLRRQMASAPRIHPDWNWFEILSAFVEQPSENSLAETAEHLFSPPSVAVPQWIEEQMPWQLSACFRARAKGMNDQQLIAKIREGALGRVADWERWEGLNDRGVRLEQLKGSGHALSVSDSALGMLFSNSSWTRTSGERESSEAFVAAVCEELPNIDASGGPSDTLVDLCTVFSTPDDFYGTMGDTLFERLMSLVCLEGMAVPNRMLPEVITRGLDRARCLSLLAGTGLNVRAAWPLTRWSDKWIRSFEQYPWIAERLVEHPDSAEIIGALSFLPPAPVVDFFPPKVLDACRHKSQRYAQAVTAFTALAEARKACGTRAEEVLSEVLALRHIYPHHLEELLDVMARMPAHPTDTDDFLLALQKESGIAMDLRIRQKILTLLLQSLERRQAVSELTDPAQPQKARY